MILPALVSLQIDHVHLPIVRCAVRSRFETEAKSDQRIVEHFRPAGAPSAADILRRMSGSRNLKASAAALRTMCGAA
jgi:hypothetical protein